MIILFVFKIITGLLNTFLLPKVILLQRNSDDVTYCLKSRLHLHQGRLKVSREKSNYTHCSPKVRKHIKKLESVVNPTVWSRHWWLLIRRVGWRYFIISSFLYATFFIFSRSIFHVYLVYRWIILQKNINFNRNNLFHTLINIIKLKKICIWIWNKHYLARWP